MSATVCHAQTFWGATGRDGAASDNGGDEWTNSLYVHHAYCILSVASRILARLVTGNSFDTVGKFVDWVPVLCLLARNLSLFNRIDAVNIDDQSDVMYEPSHVDTSHGYCFISLTLVQSGGVDLVGSVSASKISYPSIFVSMRFVPYGLGVITLALIRTLTLPLTPNSKTLTPNSNINTKKWRYDKKSSTLTRLLQLTQLSVLFKCVTHSSKF